VINKGAHDHSDAERYGKLVYMSEGSVSRYSTARMYREFVYHLCDSTSDDYILVTGLSVMVGIACAIFASMHERLNLLLYKPGRSGGEPGYYVERVVMIKELLKGEKHERLPNSETSRVGHNRSV